jgi:hypothetical protein
MASVVVVGLIEAQVLSPASDGLFADEPPGLAVKVPMMYSQNVRSPSILIRQVKKESMRNAFVADHGSRS